MYRMHFGLTRHPFDKEIPADELFAYASASELETRVTHLLELRGIGLITGDSGSGKTTAVRKVVSDLHSGLYRVLYVPLSTGNAMDLYRSIAWELGLSVERSRAALYRQIRAEVTRLVQESKTRPVLVVDEAHHLRSELLEELRLLTNYAMDAENRLCMVLIGQPELRRRVGIAAHEALNQRIVVRHHLAGLEPRELPGYVTHRMRRAGTELPLFEPQALEALFQATNGMPRKVNLLAHHALFAAAIAKSKVVTAEHVTAAVSGDHMMYRQDHFPTLDHQDVVDTPELVPIVALRRALELVVEILEAVHPQLAHGEPLHDRRSPEPWLALGIVAQARALRSCLDDYRHAVLLRLPRDEEGEYIGDDELSRIF